ARARGDLEGGAPHDRASRGGGGVPLPPGGRGRRDVHYRERRGRDRRRAPRPSSGQVGRPPGRGDGRDRRPHRPKAHGRARLPYAPPPTPRDLEPDHRAPRPEARRRHERLARNTLARLRPSHYRFALETTMTTAFGTYRWWYDGAPGGPRRR